MTELLNADVVVVGAGVVGLACAAALAKHHYVLVLEAETAIGTQTSSRNSEVIHAGIYHPTGSLKHELCVRGRRLLYPYLEARQVSYRRSGKLIVATSAEEDSKVEAIHRQALGNGVEGMRLLSGAEARALEPNLRCTLATRSSETGIVDSHGLMLALQGEIEDAGGAIAFGAPVLSGEILDGGGFELDVGGEHPVRLRCATLVNAGGLKAQALAAAMRRRPNAVPPLSLAKGSYFSYGGAPAFSQLIYPAPVDGGLGVHVTLDLAGRMRFGPDVEWLDHDDPDSVDYAVDPRRADAFYAAVRRYWPGLPDGALVPDYAGCRPKLSGPGAAADFRIDGPRTHGQEGLVELFGVESPGLTSALAIAEYVVCALS
uniref:FAD dependent oxidoreductase n=1 Tax=Caulobacter sp. (strain K31) TaxID=366602 RepID=B0T5A8_CAUSK